MRELSRRSILLGMGGLLAAAGCGSSDIPADGSDAGTSPSPIPTGTASADAGSPPSSDAGTDADPVVSGADLLADIDTIVVLMMENRSFDHFLGALKQDATYKNKAAVAGLTGSESNLNSQGQPVVVHKLLDFTPEDPPHNWDPVHSQWNNGKLDGFVKAHAGPSESDVMGFHDRSQLPFYYWLADNYTVFDHWHSSVLGPTWPNRYYLHACTSVGIKSNLPVFANVPDTIWERMAQKGLSFTNYYAGIVSWYTGAFAVKVPKLHPVKKIDAFFDDAKFGRLPNLVVIDPDFQSNDDHPDHDIQRGQAFVASIYKALAESPQWSKCLLLITYDEHGGFFDHVPPPAVTDPNPDFGNLGIRVPAFAVGPTVRRGHLSQKTFDHCAVAKTLKTRYGIASLGPRMDSAEDITSVLEPKFYKKPQAPASGMPTFTFTSQRLLRERMGTNSQPQLEEMIRDGRIAPEHVDRRSTEERTADWLKHARALGVVHIRD
ncbi:MAG: alkaline phosphatase family protein [Polyangiaceae bacterium]